MTTNWKAKGCQSVSRSDALVGGIAAAPIVGSLIPLLTVLVSATVALTSFAVAGAGTLALVGGLAHGSRCNTPGVVLSLMTGSSLRSMVVFALAVVAIALLWIVVLGPNVLAVLRPTT